eukprot:Skav212441  [mRNA]  locus=scaffold6620:13679:14323:+ [translate_table: standard]
MLLLLGNPIPTDLDEVILNVRVRGGGLVRKAYVKKEERVANLVRKSKTYVSKKIEDRADVVGAIPEKLRPLIAEIETKLGETKQKLIANEMTLKNVIETLDDTKLHQVIECMEATKREHTEERLWKIAPMLIEDFAVLDASLPRLVNLRLDIFDLLLEAFAKTYTIEKGADVSYSPDVFLADLKGLESYRRGLRRSSHAPLEGGNDENSGCGLM